MKNPLSFILDGLTYKDLAGKRHPRTFALLGGIVLLVVFALFGVSAWERRTMLSKTQATPHPLHVAALPVYTMTPTQLPTTTTACPTAPESWSFTDVPISRNYKRIQPTCVYDGLAHTVAWTLAVREGYSRADATTALGFDAMPLQLLEHILILTDLKGPLLMPLTFIPPHPDLTEWRVDADGQPSVAYGLRGCFRTSSVVGNRVERWDGDYAVICVVVEDVTGISGVTSLDGHLYTTSVIPTRSFLLFGYAGDGIWRWLGTESDPSTGSGQALRLPIDDPAKNANERSIVAAFFGAQPWDAKWLDERYGMSMRPLPDNWRAATDEADKQAILNTLNQEKTQP